MLKEILTKRLAALVPEFIGIASRKLVFGDRYVLIGSPTILN